MTATVVVKLGSSIVAHEDGRLRREVLRRICADLAAARAEGWQVVVVSSGAIARGVHALGLKRRPRAIEELQAASAVGQGKLYHAYEEMLHEEGLVSAQVLLTFEDMAVRSSYLNARQTLRTLLSWGVVPVLNENDTTATDEISFGDNDFLAAQVAILIDAQLLLLLTGVDGLMSADPSEDRNARLISEVDSAGALGAVEVSERTSPLGSGGMRSKVLAAEMVSAAGIAAVICNGMREDALRRALRGERVGTRFAPRASRASAFKLWLRHAKPIRGTIAVDEGAARALSSNGTSLLPVGITEVEGEFAAGDAVEIMHEGRRIGKGIVNYSSTELSSIQGLNSADVRSKIANSVEEAVHRDHMVIEAGQPS